MAVKSQKLVGQLERLLRGQKTSSINVALDIEGTLADISTPSLAKYNKLHGTSWKVGDITDWGFESIKADVREMMGLFTETWKMDSNQIKRTCDVELLHNVGKMYNLDVVTSRMGVDMELKSWLNSVGLGEVRLVVNDPKKEKTNLQYSVYIDDSPLLAREVANSEDKLILLIKQRWNTDVRGISNRVIPVNGVDDAANALLSVARLLDGR